MRLIDADKLDWEYIEEEYYTTIDTVRACKCLVLNAPTIDPVRHGKWEKTTCFQAENMYECSECRWYMYGEKVVKAAAYCPNCGAKMDEVDK